MQSPVASSSRFPLLVAVLGIAAVPTFGAPAGVPQSAAHESVKGAGSNGLESPPDAPAALPSAACDGREQEGKCCDQEGSGDADEPRDTQDASESRRLPPATGRGRVDTGLDPVRREARSWGSSRT